MLKIKPYTSKNYTALKEYYIKNGWFDEETDSQQRIDAQVSANTDSVLLALEGDEIVGTTTLLFTGRIGLFFRLIGDTPDIRKKLLRHGELLFNRHGYSEVHIMAPTDSSELQKEYESRGFKKGRSYSWFWKGIGV